MAPLGIVHACVQSVLSLIQLLLSLSLMSRSCYGSHEGIAIGKVFGESSSPSALLGAQAFDLGCEVTHQFRLVAQSALREFVICRSISCRLLLCKIILDLMLKISLLPLVVSDAVLIQALDGLLVQTGGVEVCQGR